MRRLGMISIPGSNFCNSIMPMNYLHELFRQFNRQQTTATYTCKSIDTLSQIVPDTISNQWWLIFHITSRRSYFRHQNVIHILIQKYSSNAGVVWGCRTEPCHVGWPLSCIKLVVPLSSGRPFVWWRNDLQTS